jgi:hypothetical protein
VGIGRMPDTSLERNDLQFLGVVPASCLVGFVTGWVVARLVTGMSSRVRRIDASMNKRSFPPNRRISDLDASSSLRRASWMDLSGARI